MKHYMRITRKTTLLAVILFSLSAAVEAKDTSIIRPSEPVTFKYLGKVGDQPMFHLELGNGKEKLPLTITVRDQFHQVLYQEKVLEAYYTRKFLLNTDEIGDDNLFFEISGWQSNKVIVYQVNRHTRSLDPAGEIKY